jgi:hypothetical protein
MLQWGAFPIPEISGIVIVLHIAWQLACRILWGRSLRSHVSCGQGPGPASIRDPCASLELHPHLQVLYLPLKHNENSLRIPVKPTWSHSVRSDCLQMRRALIPGGTKGTSSGTSSSKNDQQKGSDRPPAYPASVHTEMWPLHNLEDIERMRVYLPAKSLTIPDLERVNQEEEIRGDKSGGRFLLP